MISPLQRRAGGLPAGAPPAPSSFSFGCEATASCQNHCLSRTPQAFIDVIDHGLRRYAPAKAFEHSDDDLAILANELSLDEIAIVLDEGDDVLVLAT